MPGEAKPKRPMPKSPGGGKKGRKMPPEFLRDMRHVYRTESAGEDNTPGRKLMRKLLADDPVRFVERLQRAEREWAATKKGAAQGGGDSSSSEGAASAVDEGTEKALRILDEWLSDPSNWGE